MKQVAIDVALVNLESRITERGILQMGKVLPLELDAVQCIEICQAVEEAIGESINPNC